MVAISGAESRALRFMAMRIPRIAGVRHGRSAHRAEWVPSPQGLQVFVIRPTKNATDKFMCGEAGQARPWCPSGLSRILLVDR
jgi:hypothetical protein